MSKSEQKKRFGELLKRPDTECRVDKHDILQNRNYETNLKQFENMIQQSNFAQSEWNIIESDDTNYATIKIYKILINKIEKEINKLNLSNGQNPADVIEPTIKYEPPQVSILSSVDPDKDISQEEYKEKLNYYQKKLSYLGFKLYSKRRPVVIVYEGWDAAGKGGNIRRLAQELDPRGYEVVPVAAPSQEELAHHYLWRFWKSVPKDGHIAIFDRSWYGRVLVERVEGFCTDIEWQRAYREINDMEMHLYNHGTIFFKFWLHIDKDEQLRRFEMRESDVLKQYKITEEDWRNREKWDIYEKAVDEMLFRTSTNYAPWTVVESNNKKYARIKTLKLVVDKLEEELK
jgi:polyphosphate:AMP phosphotransferase